MTKKPKILLSDVTNIVACSVFDGLGYGGNIIVTADEVAGRITVTRTKGSAVIQRFHLFVVEEPE